MYLRHKGVVHIFIEAANEVDALVLTGEHRLVHDTEDNLCAFHNIPCPGAAHRGRHVDGVAGLVDALSVSREISSSRALYRSFIRVSSRTKSRRPSKYAPVSR